MNILQKNKPNEFINWLLNRLKFKYKENEIVLNQIDTIFHNYKLFPKNVPIDLIDSICRKHYPDFDIDRSPDINIGYTPSERLQIRNLVLDIIKDTSNYNS